jgi:hypothetical protein
VLPVLVIHLQASQTGAPSLSNPPAVSSLRELGKKPKNNAEFYLGKGRQVLEMAEIDDDDDENGAYDQSLQISRWAGGDYFPPSDK